MADITEPRYWELTFAPQGSFYRYPENTLDIPYQVSFNEAVCWLLALYPEAMVKCGDSWALFKRSTLEADLTTYGTAF